MAIISWGDSIKENTVGSNCSAGCTTLALWGHLFQWAKEQQLYIALAQEISFAFNRWAGPWWLSGQCERHRGMRQRNRHTFTARVVWRKQSSLGIFKCTELCDRNHAPGRHQCGCSGDHIYCPCPYILSLFMIWRSWVQTPVGSNLGCEVLLSKSYLN